MQQNKELGGDAGGPAAHRFLSRSSFGSDLNKIVEPGLNSIDWQSGFLGAALIATRNPRVQ